MNGIDRMDGRLCRCPADGTSTLCSVVTNAEDSPIRRGRCLEARIRTIACFSHTNSSGCRQIALQSAKKMHAFECIRHSQSIRDNSRIDFLPPIGNHSTFSIGRATMWIYRTETLQIQQAILDHWKLPLANRRHLRRRISEWPDPVLCSHQIW